ncbi:MULTISPECIES: IS110 family transposase [Enterococcus]|uniref:IS110 family transposase n=1 Tax=Enterococcus TaxID=1350 RepID=UPI00232E18FD|nr:hypothetical protein [Enterococcus gallinarum]WCG08703.1 hypothetical protein PML87_14605 [Enterococcus gallinarum]
MLWKTLGITHLTSFDPYAPNGYPTFSNNPFLIKEFAKSQSLRKTKTDKKDAMTIVRKLRTMSEKLCLMRTQLWLS